MKIGNFSASNIEFQLLGKFMFLSCPISMSTACPFCLFDSFVGLLFQYLQKRTSWRMPKGVPTTFGPCYMFNINTISLFYFTTIMIFYESGAILLTYH